MVIFGNINICDNVSIQEALCPTAAIFSARIPISFTKHVCHALFASRKTLNTHSKLFVSEVTKKVDTYVWDWMQLR